MTVGPSTAAPAVQLTVLIVGAGLIGGSIGLACRAAGWQVWLDDEDPETLRLAKDLGAGVLIPRGVGDSEAPDLVVVAVPPHSFGLVIRQLFSTYPECTFTDVGSVKAHPEAEVWAIAGLRRRYVGGHPMAGRERSGPAAARADLFVGRTWAVCAPDGCDPDSVSLVNQLVRACGATPLAVTAEEHDAAVALVSHAPQVVASLLAASLVDADSSALQLAGQGLRDTIRIAGSSPELWTEILRANAHPLLSVLDRLSFDLGEVRRELAYIATGGDTPLGEASYEPQSALATKRRVDSDPVRELLARGVEGRDRLPGKHGQVAGRMSVVQVVVPDRSGELARLFLRAGEVGVNIEDVRIEHSPGQEVGLVELFVAPGAAGRLATALRERGWAVYEPVRV